MRKRILLSCIALLAFIGINPLMAGGGPDSYGYVWLDSNDSGGPTYNWVDIINRPGAVQVAGLADDNSVGMFNIGWDFHYYWSDVNQVKIGTNGWIGFNNIANIAHCFPTVPTAGGAGDNFLAPFMSDLNFAGATNPGSIHYWSNNVDSFVITYANAPWWVNATPDWIGDNTFQVILCGADSSITFQYDSMTPNDFNDTQFCAADLEIGIENLTGNIGLEVANETVPANNYAVKFIYPSVVTFQVPDATPAWNANTDNAGQFFLVNSQVNLETNIANVGNSDITNNINVNGKLQDLALNQVWADDASLNGLTFGTDTTLAFDSVATLAPSGQYNYIVNVVNSQDINPSNNETTVEVNVVDCDDQNGNAVALSYATGNPADGGVSWTGGGNNSGIGIEVVPPAYPFTITEIEVFLFDADQDPNTPAPAGYSVNVYDATSLPGASLASETVTGTPMESQWLTTALTTPVTITSGSFFVSWLMGADGVTMGTESIGPKSQRVYEILNGQWALYRNASAEDALIRVNGTVPSCVVLAAGEAASQTFNMELAPNPSYGMTNVNFELVKSSNVELRILNAFGQLVEQRSLNNLPSGNHAEAINTSNFANGIYFVSMIVNGQKMVKKLVVTQ